MICLWFFSIVKDAQNPWRETSRPRSACPRYTRRKLFTLSESDTVLEWKPVALCSHKSASRR
ncbi:hypothetical protein ERO13_D03G131433v2 [Gossypium hirsutum]|nr:hypothetical protein ERO13_D03G131433v2 [Gossypium hirsutum]